MDVDPGAGMGDFGNDARHQAGPQLVKPVGKAVMGDRHDAGNLDRECHEQHHHAKPGGAAFPSSHRHRLIRAVVAAVQVTFFLA